MLEGKCVNTMVRTKPESRCQPGRCQRGNTAEDIRSEENAAQRRRVHAKTEIKPVGGETLNHEAAAKRIERKQA